MMLLPDAFGGKAEDRLELSAGSMEDIALACQSIAAFGRERGMDERVIQSLLSCTEELADSVMRHAFAPRKSQYLDIILLCRGDKLIVRMRDNGAQFDPIAHLQAHPNSSPLEILHREGIAEDMIYRRSAGLNNLTITLKQNAQA